MASVDQKYILTTVEDSVREKDWAAGSSKQADSAEYVIDADGAAHFRQITYSPVWLKIIDEVIVNAIDHAIRCGSTANKVTYINVVFTAEGYVSVSNDGPGIEIALHNAASAKYGRQMYVPEFIFGTLFQGSNRVKTEYPGTIIGGTNGVGAKLANIFSTYFAVETVWGSQIYTQCWRNGMTICDPPTIQPITAVPATKQRSHTTIAFKPDYSKFEYTSALMPEQSQSLCEIVRARVYLAAAYVCWAVPGVTVSFNGTAVPIRSMADYARVIAEANAAANAGSKSALDIPQAITANLAMAGTGFVGSGKAAARQNPYTWEVAVIARGRASHRQPQPPKEISVVNGVVVSKGNHTKKWQQQLVAAVKAEIIKLLDLAKTQQAELVEAIKPNQIIGRLTFLINAKIPSPGWSGQRKDEVLMDKHLSLPPPPQQFVTAIAAALQDNILGNVLSTQAKPAPVRGGREKVDGFPPEKYQPAGRLGRAASLLMVEGDSAMGQIKTGIGNARGYDRYGFISLGGVIINARKETKAVSTADKEQTDDAADVSLIQSTKLQNNKLMNALRVFVGLNTSAKYKPGTPTYAAEMRALKYGCVIGCVDQDHDGVGNIFGLILNLFERFWPNLLEAGFVKRFETPRMRAFPRSGRVINFYTDEEYRLWSAANSSTLHNYKIKYYKGLGTHDRTQMIAMCRSFDDHVFTYRRDPASASTFQVYFGDEPRLRKIALSQPVEMPSVKKIAEQERTLTIDCSDHLRYETHLFQCDSILRHLPSAMDGMTQGGRLILHGAQRAWPPGGRRDEMKVAQLAGFISEHENYLHGEESLSKSITGKAFLAPGGRVIPQLIPIGGFGSRLAGGADAAKPRYIYTRLNSRVMDLIYPAADYPLLEFEWDEGKRGAPAYYVPVLPMAVLDSVSLPAHGWNLSIWARDVGHVISLIRRMIDGNDRCVIEPKPDSYGWFGHFADIRGVPYSFGRYELEALPGDTANTVANTTTDDETVTSDDSADEASDNEDSAKDSASAEFASGERRLLITELPLRVWTNKYLADLEKKKDYDEIIAHQRNLGDDRRVRIEITLQPDALSKLQGDLIYTDGIEEWFGLRASMASRLNLVGRKNEVIEFDTYRQIITYWFGQRRDLYVARINRELAILALRIRAHSAILQYLVEGPRMHNISVAKMCERLAADGYPRINHVRVDDPGFATIDELEELMFGAKATYDWALNTRDRDRSDDNIAKYREKVAALQKQYDALAERSKMGRFVGAQIWLDELDAIEAEVAEGRKTEWRYGDAAKYQYD